MLEHLGWLARLVGLALAGLTGATQLDDERPFGISRGSASSHARIGAAPEALCPILCRPHQIPDQPAAAPLSLSDWAGRLNLGLCLPCGQDRCPPTASTTFVRRNAASPQLQLSDRRPASVVAIDGSPPGDDPDILTAPTRYGSHQAQIFDQLANGVSRQAFYVFNFRYGRPLSPRVYCLGSPRQRMLGARAALARRGLAWRAKVAGPSVAEPLSPVTPCQTDVLR